jgi:hypothetical protein
MNKTLLLLALCCCMVNAYKFIPKHYVKYNGTLYIIKKNKKQPKYLDSLFSDVNIVDTIAVLLF